MLQTLRIKNLALVADISLDLEPGYIALTGETGAGKSVILGALNLLVGQRADRGAIRSGADQCHVEALFHLADPLLGRVNALLEGAGIDLCEEGRLIIRRSFTTAGANKQFVNGSPTSLAMLGELGGWLVDMHGPNDHHSLLHPSRQLAFLDAFAKTGPLLGSIQAPLAELQRMEEARSALFIDETEHARQIDLLRHQAVEIEAAHLNPAEEEDLLARHSRASNAARLIELGRSVVEVLAEADPSAADLLGGVGRSLQELRRFDPSTGHLAESHAQIAALLQDLTEEIGAYVEKIEIDPGQLAELEERLNLVQSLKRKYGSTLADVIQFGSAARQRLLALENKDSELAKIDIQAAAARLDYERIARELSAARRKAVPKLVKSVVSHLRDLGFKQSQFEIHLATAEPRWREGRKPGAAGLDEVEFQFAPNPGEPQRPLRSIASSGELSRVMLAIKTALAAEDEVPVLVFDEVDANVGGETAHAVGAKMRRVGDRRQVLCVTHLAQVAAAANTHFLVSKEVAGGRTISHIVRLDPDARVEEISRMLGGRGEAARRHAQELLSQPGL